MLHQLGESSLHLFEPAREEPPHEPGILVDLDHMPPVRRDQIVAHLRPGLEISYFHVEPMFNRIVSIYQYIFLHPQQNHLVSRAVEDLLAILRVNRGTHQQLTNHTESTCGRRLLAQAPVEDRTPSHLVRLTYINP